MSIDWKVHTQTICSKLASFTYALELKKTTDLKTALSAYYAYADAWLRYGVVLWGNSHIVALREQPLTNNITPNSTYELVKRAQREPASSVRAVERTQHEPATSLRYSVCSKCQRTGHLRRVCPDWGEAERSGLHFGQAQLEGEMEVDGHNYDMEQELNHLCLNDFKPNRDNTVLKFYDGSKIRPLGIIKPTVRYGNRTKVLELFVIDCGTTSLLGRQWLTELKIDVPQFSCNFVSYSGSNEHVNKKLENLLNRFKELFSGGLGRYTGGKATLTVREGATPVYHRARPLPYALRERVDNELDAMLRAGVIEPVVDHSDWASPLVPIPKPDGTLRLCADYKSTLNPALLIDRYPLPKIEDVLVNLNGNQYFSKIDLSQAYNQVELDESKRYTVINTHRGLFRYNRLVYGLASSVGIFQRIMTELLKGIPNVQVFLDDVIIGGKSENEHIHALEMVLRRLLGHGLKLKKSKCVFLTKEVTYLGYVVSQDGIRADKSKVKAVLKMPTPQSVTELRSFLGMVNFFAKFIRNISSILSPLYNLLRKNVEWKWDGKCERSFQKVKQLLMSAEVLCHYDPNRPLVLTCDASARGVGAVLSQRGEGADGRERAVAYASRTLSDAETNYSQIHREALAIIFGIKKFHQYLYGRRFLLRTDHKPLVSIFGQDKSIPQMTASRMQRWAVILSAYNYEIEYVKTTDNCADGLSRLPEVGQTEEASIPEQTYLHFVQDALMLDYNVVKQCTAKDVLLSRVRSYVRDGWPEECDIDNLRPYFNRKRELYEELGCVMWGHRVVIPESCRDRVLEIIHEPHMGIVKSKALARSYVWWPGVDEAVEAACRACTVCAAHADQPPRHAPCVWPWPSRPWCRLHLDYLGPINGTMYLVVLDAMSKWIEVFLVPSTSASFTIKILSELWSKYGLPKQLVTDNGPPFTRETPAMLLMNRRLRTRLDALKSDRGAKALAAQKKQTEAGGVQRSVDEGDQVWYRQYLQGEKWVAVPNNPVDTPTTSEPVAGAERSCERLKRRMAEAGEEQETWHDANLEDSRPCSPVGHAQLPIILSPPQTRPNRH
ncbi:uncharacterized protein K02A2.6-like, partial [Hyposmocoma kahamanoa]|uniref:uncharacterized protein K02A2.6-like n=1 Tax=Hyposmocoma kahamanoa TaxID=1477025 RepID=UPI000E6D7279